MAGTAGFSGVGGMAAMPGFFYWRYGEASQRKILLSRMLSRN